MRLPLLLILPVLLLDALVDWYICRVVRRRCRPVWFKVALWSSVLLAAALILIIVFPKKGADDTELARMMWGLFVYFSIYVGKYIFVLVDLLGKIPRLFGRRRIKGFAWAGAILGVVVTCVMCWGTINRYNLQVRAIDFADSRVPEAFDGFRVAHISDIHCGSYGSDTTFLSQMVDRINRLHPDVVLFTGDIVNRHSSELEPFVSTLSRLQAPFGVYSVLGNHDYGDYYRWPSDEAKAADRRLLADLQARMGWKLLNNASAPLHLGGDSIVIIGVENIGDPPFPVYGDLDTAYPAIGDEAFKILLSHNPAHWSADIKDAPDKNIPLTLAGHTHAMQCELFGVSPAALRYDTWGGMYADADKAHSLYVNIGIGEVGFPARIGATPEITLITLHKQ